jgi:hypothetical protein
MAIARLHPKAAENLDKTAKALRPKLAPVQCSATPLRFQTDQPVAAHITSEDVVGPVSMTMVMPLTGEVVSRAKQTDEGWRCLDGDGCNELRKLARSIARTEALRDTCAEETVEEVLFDWLVTDDPVIRATEASAYLHERLDDVCREATVFVPLTVLELQSPKTVGNVKLVPLSKAVFDRWEQQSGDTNGFETLRKTYQAKVACVATVFAEPRRAVELVQGWTEQVISSLKLYHPAAMDPRVTCYLGPVGGTVAIPEAHSLAADGPDGCLLAVNANVEAPPQAFSWQVSDQTWREMLDAGLGGLDMVLRSETRTDFQNVVLGSIRLYSEGASRWTLADRLVYLFAALETLLLRNNSEPISQNVGERLAFLVGDNGTDRRRVVADVRAAYSERSRFVHHGRCQAPSEELLRVFLYAWHTFCALAGALDRYETKDALLQELDDRKLS